VGVQEYIEPDVFVEKMNSGDRILLCSDGLYPVVTSEEIIEVMQSNSLAQISECLIAAANEGGGPDNITVVVAEVL